MDTGASKLFASVEFLGKKVDIVPAKWIFNEKESLKCFELRRQVLRLVHGNGIPMGNVPWDGMEWDCTHCISHGTYGTVAM